ncbi:MAG: radical SAM protein [Candidatus Poribacteria bacterium]|nr:MAG: radical SAM protein [Candidatus Poribacteria bacterium]
MNRSPLSARAAEDRRLLNARMERIDFNERPFTVVWEVTRACMLACLHCRAEAQRRRHPLELSTEEGKRLLDEIKSFGDPIMVFTGGDPMMRKDLFELLEYSVRIGLRTSLTPTATRLVTRERLRRVQEAGVRRIAISLDGPDPETHDFFRGFPGSFRRTIEILDDAAALGISLQINTSVTRHNLARLPEMIPLLQRYGIVQWSVFFLVPTGRGKREDMISPEEHEQTYHWLWELSQEAPFDIKATAAQAYRRVAIQRALEERRRSGSSGPVTFAGAGYRYSDGLHRPAQGVNDGKGIVFVSHIGEVYPSGFLPICVGNVREQPLPEIYRNAPVLRELRDPSRLKGKCGVCEFREICGGNRGRAYALTGDYLESDPSCVYLPPAWRERMVLSSS